MYICTIIHYTYMHVLIYRYVLCLCVYINVNMYLTTSLCLLSALPCCCCSCLDQLQSHKSKRHLLHRLSMSHSGPFSAHISPTGFWRFSFFLFFSATHFFSVRLRGTHEDTGDSELYMTQHSAIG